MRQKIYTSPRDGWDPRVAEGGRRGEVGEGSEREMSEELKPEASKSN